MLRVGTNAADGSMVLYRSLGPRLGHGVEGRAKETSGRGTGKQGLL